MQQLKRVKAARVREAFAQLIAGARYQDIVNNHEVLDSAQDMSLDIVDKLAQMFASDRVDIAVLTEMHQALLPGYLRWPAAKTARALDEVSDAVARAQTPGAADAELIAAAASLLVSLRFLGFDVQRYWEGRIFDLVQLLMDCRDPERPYKLTRTGLLARLFVDAGVYAGEVPQPKVSVVAERLAAAARRGRR